MSGSIELDPGTTATGNAVGAGVWRAGTGFAGVRIHDMREKRMNRTTADNDFSCCRGLFFTQLEAGSVVLECCVCGRRWQRDTDDQWQFRGEARGSGADHDRGGH